MPGNSDISLGNMQLDMLLGVTLSPASVAANTSAEQTFTVNGLVAGDVLVVQKPTAQAGLGIVGWRVSAQSTLAITFGNFTASPIVPTAAEVYLVNVNRRENFDQPLPTAVV